MALVLIIDDSPTEVHVMKTALEKNGFETAVAEDGASGLKIARDLKPDVILMDVVMPGVNGFQATRELARNPDTSDIPVIIVTTKGLETDRIWGMRQGAVEYLVKPVTEAELVDRAKAAISH